MIFCGFVLALSCGFVLALFVFCVFDLSCFHGWAFVVVASVVLFCCVSTILLCLNNLLDNENEKKIVVTDCALCVFCCGDVALLVLFRLSCW